MRSVMEKTLSQNDSGIRNHSGLTKEHEQNYRSQDEEDTFTPVGSSILSNRTISNGSNVQNNNSSQQHSNPSGRLSMLMNSSYAAPPPQNNLRGSVTRNPSVISLPGYQPIQQQPQQIPQQHYQQQQYESQIQSTSQIGYPYPGSFSQMSQSHMSVASQQSEPLLPPLLSQLPQYIPSFDQSSSGILPPQALYQPGLLLELQASQRLMKRYKIDISEQDNTQPLEYLKQFRRQDPLTKAQHTTQLSFEVLNNLQLYTEILYRAIQDKTAEHLRSSGYMRSRLSQAAKGAVQSILEYSESRTVVPKYAREGDWLCTCSNLNFAYRNSCNKCLLLKPAYSVEQASEETSEDEGEGEDNGEQSFCEDAEEEGNDQEQSQMKEQEKQKIVDEDENDRQSEQKGENKQEQQQNQDQQSQVNQSDEKKQDNQKSNRVKSDQKTPLSEKSENNSILGLQSASIAKKNAVEAKKPAENTKTKKSDLCKRPAISNRSSYHEDYDENDDEEYEEDEEICISSKRQLILSEMVWVCKCCRSINHCKVDACISCGMYRIINQNTLRRLARRSQKKLAKYAQKQAEMLLKIEQSELYIAHQNLMEQQQILAAQEQQKQMQLRQEIGQVDKDEESEELEYSQVIKESLEDSKKDNSTSSREKSEDSNQDKVAQDSTISSTEASQISIETSSESNSQQIQQKVSLEAGKKDKLKLDSKNQYNNSTNENINSSNNSEICKRTVRIEEEEVQQSQTSTLIVRNPLEDIGDTSSNEILSESEQSSNETPIIEGKQGKSMRIYSSEKRQHHGEEEYHNTMMVPYPEESAWE